MSLLFLKLIQNLAYLFVLQCLYFQVFSCFNSSGLTSKFSYVTSCGTLSTGLENTLKARVYILPGGDHNTPGKS